MNDLNNSTDNDMDITKNIEHFVGSATQIPLDRPLAGTSDSQFVPPPPKLKLDLNVSKFSGSDLEKMENQFNKLLSEYTTKYKLMSEELIHNNSQTVLQKYANNNIKLKNDYYYVNNYGFASKYDNETWKNRSVTCSKSPIEIPSEDFKKLLKGPPMGKGQACGVSGFNIRGEDGWTGWVDIKGTAHHYPDMDVWNNRNQSCAMNVVSLTNTEVDAIPKGSDMTQNTFCERLNVDPTILQSLASLNSQMLALGNQIMAETDKLSKTDQHLDEQLKTARKHLAETMKKIHHNKKNIDPFSKDTFFNSGSEGSANVNRTFEATARNSQINLNMNYLKYIIGLISVVLLVIFSFHAFSSERQSVASIIVLILVILFVLKNAGSYIYNKFL